MVLEHHRAENFRVGSASGGGACGAPSLIGIGTLPPGVREEWEETGAIEKSLETARETAEAAFAELDEAEQSELAQSFGEQLPPAAQSAVFKFIAIEPGNWRPASDEFLAKFAEAARLAPPCWVTGEPFNSWISSRST